MSELEFLRRVGIFASLEDDELDVVRGYLREMTCGHADAVFQQGDVGRDLYIVRKGRVIVKVRTPDGTEVDLASFGPGDFFGEMSIFEDEPRSATCAMPDGGNLYRMSKDDLFALMADHPPTAIRIMYAMVSITTGRLHKTSAFLAGLVQWGEGARRRAITDDLTGLFNRRHLDHALEQQYVEARVRSARFSLIMMDLDRFHAINDTWGQPFGDQVIAAVAPSVQGNLRPSDIASRYGGDEFVIILPDTAAEEALPVAEAIRRSVEALSIATPGGEKVTITTSQGIAEYPRHAATTDALKQVADQALYRAKQTGRNRATIA